MTLGDQVDTVNGLLCLETNRVKSDLFYGKAKFSWNYSPVFEGFAVIASTTYLVLFLLQHQLKAKSQCNSQRLSFH